MISQDETTAGPLSGLLVVALEQAVAAPLCTCRLADAGARVIKIERPEGDFARGYDAVARGSSAYFVWLNRGKQSLVLDIKAPADQALLARILAQADVFVQNLAPGAAARAGFDPAELRRRHPRLITCSITGYGESGPYRDMKAYDLLIQAETGLASVTGGPEAPGRVGVSISDAAAGLNAHAAILEALIARGLTGQGRSISISLFDATAELMTVPLLHHDYGGRGPQRIGLAHPSIAPYGVFQAADGAAVLIAIQNEREWHRLCAGLLEVPALADDPRFCSNALRVANRAVLDGLVAAACARNGRAALAARLQAADIAFGWLNDVAAFSGHPQLRRAATPVDDAEIEIPVPAAWPSDRMATSTIPAIGEHSAMIRQEFSGDRRTASLLVPE